MIKKHIKLIAVMLIIGFMAATTAIANEQSIMGTVEKTDQGFVISADNGDSYQVMGADLSEMVGKTVKATGTLSEGPSGKELTVIQIEEVNE